MRWIKLAIKLLVSAALLGGLVYWLDLKTLVAKLPVNAWPVVLACVGIYLLSQAVSALRWQRLAAQLSLGQPWPSFFSWYMLGMFYSLVLPGSIGGDAARVWWLARATGAPKRTALLTVLAERGVGLMGLLWFTALFANLSPVNAAWPRWLVLGLAALAITMMLGWLVLLTFRGRLLAIKTSDSESGKGMQALLCWLQDSAQLWGTPKLMAETLFMAGLIYGFMGLIHVLLATVLGLHLPLPALLSVFGTVSLISILPVSFNGLGVREGAYVALLGLLGVEPVTAGVFSLLWLATSTLTSLLGGVFWQAGLQPINGRVSAN
ncbi:MAG: lysylphosphatidylglycerol synthase transmembrane domain-containing protein [Vampirovibrionales bacterium]|nr:lysylphosphatidylglycerol synthase transmembrane domain-containing protein [Vampirovibrionales bacterium]